MKMETKTETPIITCSNYLGYLSQRAPGKETPDECLICSKLLECKLSKPDSTPPKIEPETSAIKEDRLPVEEPEEDMVKNEREGAVEIETKAEPLPVESLGNQFAVENLGMLYASWSSTVHINKETLSSWGEKIHEVYVETKAGKKMQCKVMPSEDPRKEVVLIPDKLQLDLKVGKDDLVRVEPIIVPKKEDKTRNVVRAFSNFKQISQRLKRLKPQGKGSK